MKTTSIQAVILTAFSLPSLAADGLFDLGTLNGGSYAIPWDINAAGDVVVGEGDDGAISSVRAFRWTEATGIVSLGALNGGMASVAYSVNAAGNVVVGTAFDGAASNASRAYRWTQAAGMISLGTLNGGLQSSAYDVNDAGDVIVGAAFDGAASNVLRAFRWTQSTGMISLGMLNGGQYSAATGINATGDVVVGEAEDGAAGNAFRAFRWTQATGMINLGTLNGGTGSRARRTNATGDVVIGAAYDGAAGNAIRAFRWTQSTGMTSLGTLLNSDTDSAALAINAVGDVVVGWSGDGSNMAAYRWTQTTGMQSLEQWLASNGVDTSSSPAALAATAVNADGNVITGQLQNNHPFIARVTPAGNGLIDIDEYYRSLAGQAGLTTYAIQDADLVLNGAHGSPMRGLLASGQQAFWVTGDWARNDHGELNGRLGAGEIGYGRGLGDRLMLKFSLGRSDGRQDTSFNGDTRLDGTYVVPELIMAVADTSLRASISGYYNNGSARIDRGYFNAGSPTTSRGNTDVRTAALRLRLDWLDAAILGKTALTPYASVIGYRTQIDGYTESSGGFPVRWDSRIERSTQMRLGLDAVTQVNDRVTLLGRIEAVHRFENRGENASGEILDLNAFSIDGLEYRQDWLRAAVGAESRLGPGIGSMMLNATTEGETPSWWLFASYRWVY